MVTKRTTKSKVRASNKTIKKSLSSIKKEFLIPVSAKAEPNNYDEFFVKEIENLKDLIDVSNELSKEEWWFRGLRDSSYQLKTSLGRFLKSKGFIDFDDKAKKLENEVIENFQSNASSYVLANFAQSFSKESIGDDDGWFWLFIMQHYEIPTRLLDWTLSPITGLWFATNDWQGYDQTREDGDAILYALNPIEYLRNASHVSSIDKPPFLYSKEGEVKLIIKQFLPSESKNPTMKTQFSCMPIIGLYNNNRIKAQKGRFTVTKNPVLSLEEEIKTYSNREQIDPKTILKAFLIKKSNINKIRIEIANLGFTYLDIIPDLEGVSKTFNFNLKKKV